MHLCLFCSFQHQKEPFRKIPYLIYWYGYDSKQGYGFLGPNLFIPYEKGIKDKKYKQYEAVQRKKEEGKKLSKPDQVKLKALEEIAEDLKIEPLQRKRGIADFQEGYQLLDMKDLKATLKDSGIDEKSSDEEELTPQKKRKAEKEKGGEEEDAGAKPRISKKKKLTKKEKNQEPAVSPPSPPKGRGEAPETDQKAATAMQVDDDDIGDEESDSNADMVGGGAKDDGFEFDDEESPDEMDDEKDEDFGVAKKKGKKPTKGNARKADEGGLRKASKKQAVKKKAKPTVTKPNTEAKEKREFERCEKQYLPFIFECDEALKAADIARLEVGITKVIGIVTDASAPFIESYLVQLCKETKSFIKGHGEDESSDWKNLIKINKQFKKKISEVHEEKKPFKAENFDMPPRKKGFVAPAIKREPPSIKQDPPAIKQEEPPAIKQEDLSAIKREEPPAIKQEGVPAIKREDLDQKPAAPSNFVDKSAPEQSKTSSKKDLLHVPRKENVGSPTKVEDGPAAAPAPARATAPPPRKTFSLGNLGRLMDQDSKRKDLSKSSSFKTKPKPLPSWLAGPAVDEAPRDECRFMGFQFLRDMALHFPKGRIDVDSTALSVEKAIYQYATAPDKKSTKVYKESENPEDRKWEDVYWARVHAIVSAVCGRRDPGPLMQLILNGEFATADKLVALKDEDIRKSYEGLTIDLSSP